MEKLKPILPYIYSKYVFSICNWKCISQSLEICNKKASHAKKIAFVLSFFFWSESGNPALWLDNNLFVQLENIK
jgi:hypothetical protein